MAIGDRELWPCSLVRMPRGANDLAVELRTSVEMAAAVVHNFCAILCLMMMVVERHLVYASKCTIDASKDLNATSPLLLHPRSLEFVYPSTSNPRELSFASGDEHVMFCPNGELQPSLNSSSDLSRCVGGKTFSSLAKRKEYAIDGVHCSKSPEAVTREDVSRSCGDGGIVVNVGYEMPSKFLRTIDLCYVDELATTRWAHSRIPGAVGGFRSREPQQGSFGKGGYFKNVLMARVYPRNYQAMTFREIFDGDEKLVEKYLPSSGDKRNYFVKGHLVARADKYYHAEQHSTYFYANALPMWQSINNGNWRSLESTVRRVAGIAGDLDVYTGAIGVLRLSGKEIFLAKDKRNAKRRLVPAPKLLFKLVHDEKRNEAMVFLTANNPYLDEVPDEYKICQEYRECARRFKQFEQRFEGYTYCCTYEDFARGAKVQLPVDIRSPKALTLR